MNGNISGGGAGGLEKNITYSCVWYTGRWYICMKKKGGLLFYNECIVVLHMCTRRYVHRRAKMCYLYYVYIFMYMCVVQVVPTHTGLHVKKFKML